MILAIEWSLLAARCQPAVAPAALLGGRNYNLKLHPAETVVDQNEEFPNKKTAVNHDRRRPVVRIRLPVRQQAIPTASEFGIVTSSQSLLSLLLTYKFDSNSLSETSIRYVRTP